MVIALQFPKTQQFITQKAVSYLSERLEAKVEVGGINVAFLKSIRLTQVYIEDEQQDTLWYSREIFINLDFFSLLNKRLEINSLDVEKVTVHINRALPDSSFNFDFITEAFASDTDEIREADTVESDGWTFAIFEVNLNDIYFTLRDEVSGNEADLNLGDLSIDLDEFELEHNNFKVALVELANTRAVIVQNKIPEETEEISPLDINLILDQLVFSGVEFNYHNTVSGQRMAADIGASTFTGHEISLIDQEINLEKLELHNSHFIFEQNEKNNKEDIQSETGKETNANSPGWKVFLDELNFSENSFRLDNNNEEPVEQGMDFNHLHLNGISGNIKNINYSDSSIFANLQHLSLKEKSGFRVEELNTLFSMDTAKIQLKSLDVITGESRINDHLSIAYSSIENIADNIGELIIYAHFEQSEIGFQDLFYFMPELSENPFFAENKAGSIYINGIVEGPMEDLHIQNFEVNIAQETMLRASGRVTGLPEIEKTFFDLNLEQLVTSRNDIRSLTPDTLLPADINLPRKITATGNFKGYLEDFDAAIAVATSQGKISADVSMSIEPGNKTAAYSGKISVVNFDVGEFIEQQETVGKVSLTAFFKGSGLSFEEINARVDASVQKAELMGYKYSNLEIEGIFSQEQFVGNVTMEDENLVFNFDGNINFKDTLPDVNFKLDIVGANLQALHLTEEDYRVNGVLSADMTGNSLKNLNGNLNAREVLIIKNGKRFPIDSLLFVSVTGERHTDITIDSDFMNAWFKGTINLADLSKVMHLHLHQYFRIHEHEFEENLQPQNFDFEMALFKTELLTGLFIPDLRELDSVLISGTYNSIDKVLDANVSIEHLVYSDITMDSLNINVNSDKESLSYSVHLSEISDTLFQIENPAVTGLIENNNAEVKLQLTDDDGEERFVLAGAFSSMEDNYRFRLFPSQIIINYEKWSVPEDNYLLFDNGELLAHHIRLERNDQYIAINSLGEDQVSPPLEVAFNNFDLAVFSRLFEREEQLFRGIINGNIVLQKPLQTFTFTSELAINDFSFKEDTLGDIALKANNIGEDRYNIVLDVTNNKNQINIAGFYLPESRKNSLNFDLHLGNLNLATVEAFTAGQLTQLSGSLAGEMEISGTIDNPDITGSLHFKNAAFNLTYINSYLWLGDETVVVDEQGIYFESFTLTDTLENKAYVNGYIYTEDYRDYRFDLNVNTDNFLVLNTTSEDNDLYYGKIIVDSDVTVKGDLDLPVIDARVELLEGSALTFVVPVDELATLEREGVVEFIDEGEELNPIMNVEETPDTLTSELRTIDLNANVEVNKETSLKIIIDEVAGDYLEVFGGGTLSFGIDPGGEISLSGRYEITEGSYLLTFREFIKREFDIKQGSSITWAGDPLDAQIDITAIYMVRTSPYGLLATTTAEISEQSEELFKQQLPFQVHLLMEGELMSPEINFNLGMPEEQRDALDGQVYARLQQLNEDKAELNKQVFALLVLNRFISEDVFADGGAGGYASAARSSVSRMLTEQLNRLSSEYIKGLDLTFDLESYSTGDDQGRTELQVELSRKLLDDRITVKVEGNVDLEGEQREQTGWSDIAGDVSIEYDITEDGRYKLKVFRESEFQGVIDGNIIETGISIIYNKDYDHFLRPFKKFINELFKWGEEEDQEKKEEKEIEEKEKEEQVIKQEKKLNFRQRE